MTSTKKVKGQTYAAVATGSITVTLALTTIALSLGVQRAAIAAILTVAGSMLVTLVAASALRKSQPAEPHSLLHVPPSESTPGSASKTNMSKPPGSDTPRALYWNMNASRSPEATDISPTDLEAMARVSALLTKAAGTRRPDRVRALLMDAWAHARAISEPEEQARALADVATLAEGVGASDFARMLDTEPEPKEPTFRGPLTGAPTPGRGGLAPQRAKPHGQPRRALTLAPSFSFKDNAREAMEFYSSVFGGELALSTFGEYGDTGPSADKVMHSQLETPSGYTIMASDIPEGMTYEPGTNIAISLIGDDADELRGYWDKLSDGGTVTMPLEKRMWGDEFGMVTDRFGIGWLVTIATSQ